jgi:hypothetical protein
MNTTEPICGDPHPQSLDQRHRSSRRSLVKASLAAGLMAGAALHSPVRAQEAATPVANPAPTTAAPAVLFRDVRIFDGVTSTLSAPATVLVNGNKIETISVDAIEPQSSR